MGYNRKGVRDGTGPYKGSYIRKQGGKIGRRRKAGKKCPKRRK